jgi:hypothetical protein
MLPLQNVVIILRSDQRTEVQCVVVAWLHRPAGRMAFLNLSNRIMRSYKTPATIQPTTPKQCIQRVLCAKCKPTPRPLPQAKLASALLSSLLSYLTYLPLPLSISRYRS